jgi:ankyrin repeat protein
MKVVTMTKPRVQMEMIKTLKFRHQPCVFNSLYSAVIEGDLPCVQLLLEHGADPDLGYDDITPLMQASSCQSLPIMQKLIDAGADINCRDKMGKTALMHALKIHAEFPLLVIDDWIRDCHNKSTPKALSLNVVSLLISSGAEFNKADNNGFLPTDYALIAHLGGVEVPEELKADPVYLRLCRAAVANSFSELKLFCVSANIPQRILTLALHLAATRGYLLSCTVLLEHGADVNGLDLLENLPIESATVGLHSQLVQLMIDHGATSEGLNRALLSACMASSHRWSEERRKTIPKRRRELARCVLQHGANPNFRDRYNNEAPLKQVIGIEEDCDLAILLLEYGADPTARDDNGESLLEFASTDQMKAILQEWVNKPCHPKSK